MAQSEIDFWAERWKEGRIGFHEGRPNTYLVRHVDRLGLSAKARGRVFVPLCGKAEDLAFLAAQGFVVVGVEAVEEAAAAFFAEHNVTPSAVDRPHGRVYEAALGDGSVTIHVADVFSCTADVLGGSFDALYDRAAIVALPEATRVKYVRHVRSLFRDGSSSSHALVITFEYPPADFAPPPFPVGEDEMRALYTGATVEQIDKGTAEGIRFREAKVVATERVYAITNLRPPAGISGSPDTT